MPLFIENGRLVVGTDGNLQGCCCTDTPNNCAACCTRIVDGVWEVDKWVFTDDAGGGYSIRTEITGIGQDRLVCDDQLVTVTFTLTVPDPDTLGPPHRAYASWDYMWEYVSHTPIIGLDGILNTDGLIEWGDRDELTYSVVLKYKPCYQQSTLQMGDILVGFTTASNTLITFDDCPGYFCCDETFVCAECCWYIPMGDGSDPAGDGVMDPGTGVITYWTESNGTKMRVTLPNREVFCASGGTLDIEVTIIPPPNAPIGYEPSICITHLGWFRAGGGDLPLTPADCAAYVHTTCAVITALTFTFSGIAFGCETNPCADDGCFSVPGGFTVTANDTTDIPMSIASAGLLECVAGSDCCCDCDPCDFPAVAPVTNVVYFYDDGTNAIEFTQGASSTMKKCDESPDEDCAGCLFEIPGTWTITDLGTGIVTDTYPGDATICFASGTYTFKGGVQGGIDQTFGMEGTCDAEQVSPPDDTTTLTFIAAGTPCVVEEEP